MIEVKDVGKAYGSYQALQGVNWHIEKGDWWGIIGPNGSGKSTLIQLLSGVEKATGGRIAIHDVLVEAYPRKTLSRMLAVLQQDALPALPYSVREVLEMGRYPFQNWLGRDTRPDSDKLIEEIMLTLELKELEHRSLDELSGGQRQRVALGKVMAQEPQILLLDEPTTYLDIHYQMQFMELVASWRRKSQITVVSVLHDLNLAAQFCDELLVLREGKVAGQGKPSQILTAGHIRQVYDVEPTIVAHPDSGVPQVLLSRSD